MRKPGWLLVADFLIQTLPSHHFFVSRLFSLFSLGANINHSYVAVCLLNILLWRVVPYASYLGIQHMKSPGIRVLEVDFPPIWTNLPSELIPFLRLLLNLWGIGVGTPSIVLERVMDRRAAARTVEQRFRQSNPRALVWTKGISETRYS